jgi:hypothetical protein
MWCKTDHFFCVESMSETILSFVDAVEQTSVNLGFPNPGSRARPRRPGGEHHKTRWTKAGDG